mmetsp:Transcript_11364/g.33721  ORF Transcript_11364/g.33721 Transcript_11364/m.33721 type:complete len:210 (-) Transcript_11364:94-723(-)
MWEGLRISSAECLPSILASAFQVPPWLSRYFPVGSFCRHHRTGICLTSHVLASCCTTLDIKILSSTTTTDICSTVVLTSCVWRSRNELLAGQHWRSSGVEKSSFTSKFRARSLACAPAVHGGRHGSRGPAGSSDPLSESARANGMAGCARAAARAPKESCCCCCCFCWRCCSDWLAAHPRRTANEIKKEVSNRRQSVSRCVVMAGGARD